VLSAANEAAVDARSRAAGMEIYLALAYISLSLVEFLQGSGMQCIFQLFVRGCTSKVVERCLLYRLFSGLPFFITRRLTDFFKQFEYRNT
jgi:hypothetical protein